MNLSSNISIGNSNLSELHRDKTSLVSQLPKDIVRLIEPYLLFTKISEETPCTRIIRIAFCKKVTGSSASQMIVKTAERYNSTKIDINGISTRIQIIISNEIFLEMFFGFDRINANVLFFEPTQEFKDDAYVLRVSAVDPTILAWNSMDLHKEQLEILKNLPQRLTVVNYEDNPEYLMLKVIEKVVLKNLESFPEKKESATAALAAQSVPEQRTLMSKCTIL